MRLGQILINKGVLDNEEREIALFEQPRTGKRFGETCLAMGLLSEDQLVRGLAEQYQLQTIHLLDGLAEEPLLSANVATQHRILPLLIKNKQVFVIDDPTKIHVADIIRKETKLTQIDLRLATSKLIDEGLVKIYGGDSLWIRSLFHTGLENQVVEIVEAVLTHGVRMGASDIHFVPGCGITRLYYRIDGVMQHVKSLHVDLNAGVANYLKVLSGCDIANTRLPQDGQFERLFGDKKISFRLSFLPTQVGESIVIRALLHGDALALEEMDLVSDDREALYNICRKSAGGGLIVVSGPTGSGKTTLLAALAKHLLKGDRMSAVSLEDPPEYRLPGVRQCAVSDKLSWASGLKSILRHDPDLIIIGEIRDEETAVLAVSAALTGHRVLTTIHCHSAAGVQNRFLELGASAQTFNRVIKGIISTRLFRRVCHCVHERSQETECRLCRGSGYSGRIAAMEIIETCSGYQAPLVSLENRARELVQQQVTSKQELIRVLGIDL